MTSLLFHLPVNLIKKVVKEQIQKTASLSSYPCHPENIPVEASHYDYTRLKLHVVVSFLPEMITLQLGLISLRF